MRRPMTRRLLLAGVLSLLTLPLLACDGIFNIRDRRPDQARVVVTGQSPVPLRLVLSTNFTAEYNFETGIWDVNLITAEEYDLPLPIEQTIQLTTDRFFARLINPSTEEQATVHMEVFFDGRQWYNQQATLVDSQLEFLHVFN
jgi:hypothetical protein